MTSKEALILLLRSHFGDERAKRKVDKYYDEIENQLLTDLDRLEEYIKIEEELGIDFITLFKALKNGFYHIDKNKHIYTTKPTKGNGGSMNFYTCLECIIAEDTFGDQYIFSLKDYGKVWALTKEELEQNE